MSHRGPKFSVLIAVITAAALVQTGAFAASPEVVRVRAADAPVAASNGVPSIQIHNKTVTEGSDGGQTPAPVRLTLSWPSTEPIVVTWQVVPVDFFNVYPVVGHVTIPAGAVAADIPLRVVADETDEPDEVFSVEIVSAPGAAVTRGAATLTVADDDPPLAHGPPSVVVFDASASEGDGFARAEVLLAAPSRGTVIVHYVTHHRTASAGSDYVRKDSRLIFLPEEVRHVIRIALVDDGLPEPTESFRIDLDRIERGIVADSTATVTIVDND